MGKRSDFERVERDFYPTPYEAVVPLIPFLHPKTRFWEPCCGDGALAQHLIRHGLLCTGLSDIEPKCDEAFYLDALELTSGYMGGKDTTHIITNPPWDRQILHPMIEHFIELRPTWLLFDADWMHTKQARPYLAYCRVIASVGRVKWVPDTKMTGKDNCCWYLFDKDNQGPPSFYPR